MHDRLRTGLHISLCVLLLACAFAAQAQSQSQPDFPELTGRVVDQAGMLDAQTEARLTQMLAAYENGTTEQVVVVTLPNLQGYAIEDFGYRLGRHWGIGQEGEDNGALLIVARDEQQVRIEVGYGLEGRLTDAASSVIISQVIVPAFRQGDFARGIVEGTEAILKVLGGEPVPVRGGAAAGGERPNLPMAALLFFIFIIVSTFLGGGMGRRGRRGRSALIGGALIGAGLGRGGGGGFGGGGFGGGGGGFGGGGASGGW